MAELRAVLVGFEPDFPAAVHELGTTPVARIATRPHPPSGSCEFIAARDFVRYNKIVGAEPPVSEEVRAKARDLCFSAFVQCANRYANTNAQINDPGDYDLLFDRALAQARKLINRCSANTLVFSSMPHRCATVALLGYARATGMQTAVCIESPFPNLFWIVNDWRDTGTFSVSRRGTPNPIDTSPPKQMPFYMRGIASSGTKTRRALLKYAEFSLRYLLTPFMLLRKDGQQQVNRVLGELRESVQMLYYGSRRRDAGNVALEELPLKFVYFPLHLQPEMVTDVLGDCYRNQLLALLRLRELAPDDVFIVVKENPKQTGLIRSPLFWERLSTIPNLLFVDDQTSSFELVNRAMLTATVTGTAGWEALCSGRPALAFGYAFWRNLPGAFSIFDEPDWAQIESFSFNRRAFEKGVEEMSRHAYQGVADERYAAIVEGYSAKGNAAKLAKAIAEHLDLAPAADR